MKCKIFAIALTVALSIVPLGVLEIGAQAAPPSVDRTWNRVAQRSAGDRFEVRLKNGKSISGKFKSSTDTELTLLRNGSDTILRREDISRVYQSVDKSDKKPILFGAAAGGIVGAGIGAAVNDKATVKSPVTILLIGGASAAVGALAGWIIRGEKSKVLIYESQ